jgi:uncharacterized protein YdhG (YjbR/CyaY superfamily)
MSDTKKPAKSEGFSADERAAMKERAKELKANASKEAAEKQVLAVIAEMPEQDRALAERLHALVTASAPELSPKLWYGSPAYAKDGKVICFFQVASKYDTRYLNFGFSDSANLDEGGVWATSFAVVELTSADEAMIGKLVQKAAR